MESQKISRLIAPAIHKHRHSQVSESDMKRRPTCTQEETNTWEYTWGGGAAASKEYDTYFHIRYNRHK